MRPFSALIYIVLPFSEIRNTLFVKIHTVRLVTRTDSDWQQLIQRDIICNKHYSGGIAVKPGIFLFWYYWLTITETPSGITVTDACAPTMASAIANASSRVSAAFMYMFLTLS